jgi:hypothetical protein
MTFHHVLLDGWSMPLVVRELLALSAGQADLSVVPEATPYRNYLAWRAQQDQSAAEQAWQQALTGLTGPTRLTPADHHRVPRLPEQITVEVPQQLENALGEHARRHGLTLNTILQGAWGLLLARLSATQDVVFGTVVSGRPADLPKPTP